MNERIKELAEQAGFECWKDEPYRPEGQVIDWASNYDEELEKFAELVRADERGENDLQTAIERGTKAWADVPNASEWVDELRGNDKPPVKSYCGGKPNYCTPEVPPEVPCKTDPRAPHGFDRNASHSADRYVCECESWEPPKRDSSSWVGLTNEDIDDLWKTEYFNVHYELPRAIEAKLKQKNNGA